MRDLFTTDRFTAGHVLGTGILVFGTIGIAQHLIDRARTQGEAAQVAAIRQTRGQRWGKVIP